MVASGDGFPWLEAVAVFNTAVFLVHTYLDTRQQHVSKAAFWGAG